MQYVVTVGNKVQETMCEWVSEPLRKTPSAKLSQPLHSELSFCMILLFSASYIASVYTSDKTGSNLVLETLGSTHVFTYSSVQFDDPVY